MLSEEDDIILEDGHDINIADVVYDLQIDESDNNLLNRIIKYVYDFSRILCF